MTEQAPKKKVYKASGEDRLPNLKLASYTPIWRPNHGCRKGYDIMTKSKMLRQRSRLLWLTFTKRPQHILIYFPQMVELAKDIRYLTEQINLHITKKLEKIDNLEEKTKSND